MKLSIIVPVYNEEKTLQKIIENIQSVKFDKISKEIIIVNDASTDNSQAIIDKLKKKYKNVSSIIHEKNTGKGGAMRTGLKHFSGDLMVWHDADLEYNPENLKNVIKPILEGKTKVAYGSRLLGNCTGFSIASHYYGNKFLSFITYFLYGQKITDMETGYKMMTKEVAKSLNLKSNRFDIEPEITAKLIKMKNKIIEVPIDYHCRSFEEGKKITWRDGIVALYTLFKYRFFD